VSGRYASFNIYTAGYTGANIYTDAHGNATAFTNSSSLFAFNRRDCQLLYSPCRPS
jgi:hypothetical protein